MLQTIKRTTHTLLLNLKEIVFLSFLFRICSSILLLHTTRFLTDFSLQFCSYSYLTARNAVNFLTSPVTIVCLLFILSLLFLITYFESCILMTGYQASVCEFRISCGQLLLSSFRRGIETFTPRRLPAAIPLLSFSVVSNLYFLFHLIYKINPFCTYLPIITEVVEVKIIYLALILILAIDSFCHLFSFCYVFFENDTNKEARRKSRILFRYHPLIFFFIFLTACIAVAVFWHVLRFLCSGGIQLAVSLFVAEDIQTALMLTLEQYMILVTFALCITLGSYLHSGLITILFYRYSECVLPDEEIVYRQLIEKRQRRILIPVSAAVFLGLIIYLYFGIYDGIIQAERSIPFTQISAHRGVCSEAPENTLPAIQLAIDYLADSVEIDVQCTEDGTVIVFHDISLKRLFGTNRAVANMTFDEIRKYTFSDESSDSAEEILIPTLEEVMELVKGRINLIIELKRNAAGQDLVEKVLALIEEYDMEHQCFIQSSDYQYLREVKDLNPNLPTGYILSTAIGNYYTNEYIDYFCVRSAFVSRSSVNKAHAAGKEIFAWTVNSKTELERMKRTLVDTIITDYPIRAREIIYRQDETTLNLLRTNSIAAK